MVGLLVAAAALLALVLPRLPPLAIASRFADDVLLTALAPPEPQDSDIVIIGITEDTLSGLACRSPLDRVFLRRVVEDLENAGVRAIGLDVLLDMPTRPEADMALRASLADARVPVVLITAQEATPLTEAQRQWLDTFLAGLDQGYANLVKDRLDDAVRWHEPRLSANELSFPARIARALGGSVPEAPFEIAWRGRPDTATPPFPIYPAETVVLLPKAWLSGKVALVGGVLADGDRHRTPLSVLGSNISGVEIQAHVLAQLLSGREHPRIAWRTELLLVLALAALGGWVGGSRLSPATQALVGVAGLGTYAGGVAWAMTATSTLLPLVGGSIAWLGGLAGTAGLSLWRERAERRTLLHLFARHVSAPVAEEIWRERATFMAGGRPKPQELTATVLFSDIEGFTTVAERLEPVMLMSWLETYMDRMVGLVAAHKGLVLQFIGDALLAVYGVPVARTSEAEITADAVAAARTALAMAQAAEDLAAEFAVRGLPPVHMRIGIQTGRLVAGSLGGTQRLEYALVGDTMNTAARLEALCKTLRRPGGPPCTIVVGDATRDRLGERFVLRDIGEVELKGKMQPVQAYELEAEKI
ncbi:CHASE2 domain-containing protein [Benzoatithermus flavus]|uniref:CHASE2 domain-containing protein n=1 Tax=Benzoatithermus flavus TaxID=3108223 RepID=UPI003AAEC12C